MTKINSVLVIEMYPYHTHNFPLYKHLLPSLFHVNDLNIEYYAHPEIINTLIYPPRKHLHKIFLNEIWEKLLLKLHLRTFYFKYFIKILISFKNPDCIVLNTLESKSDQLIFESLKKIKTKIAIIHNPKRLIIHKEKNAFYFCMNEYIFNDIKDHTYLDGYLLSYFSPVEFSKVKTNDDLIIGVPGGISFNRRDYKFLISLGLMLKRKMPSTNKILFNIIGDIRKKDGPTFKTIIKENSLDDIFLLHDYLDDYEFCREINNCDFLMPLIGDVNPSYRSEKNTATLSHSSRYSIPLILQSEDAESWDIPSECCVSFSNIDDLIVKLITIDKITLDLKQRYSQHIERKITSNKVFLSGLVSHFEE